MRTLYGKTIHIKSLENVLTIVPLTILTSIMELSCFLDYGLAKWACFE